MKKVRKSATGKHTPPRGKHLADEEHLLWEHTAKSVTRVKRLKPRVGTAEPGDTDHPPRRLRAGERKDAHITPAATAKVPAPAATPAKPAPPIADFHRKKVRKIGSGQIEIDARIDLHGLTQSEAHAALSRFLHRSAARGDRHVLIVTGKGSMARRGDDTHDYSLEPKPGVLRRNVPRWLEEPDLRGLVVSYTTAAIRHGGEGALYVHLRTKK